MRAHAQQPKRSSQSIVREVLRDRGRALPAGVRRDVEARVGHSFGDVRVHTDERAAASADAIGADAYTVGRHIVFARGCFDPSSTEGQRLLAHELTHAASHAPNTTAPSGDLRISTTSEPAERHAVAVSEGAAVSRPAPIALPAIFRQPRRGFVALTGLTLNHDRITVPPERGLRFSASKVPRTAPSVTFALNTGSAPIAAGTTINRSTGAITVDAAQTGGSAEVEATQSTGGGGFSSITQPFNFTAIPGAIASTSVNQNAPAGSYGGEFTHTFRSPAGGPAALERAHVNEQFPGARGTTLVIRGPLTTLTVSIKPPGSPAAGWDLDSSGQMTGPDNVTWGNTVDARPFVVNASHRAPAHPLPQALTATQNFRNLSFPSRTYGAAAVASTTHRRAIEDRSGQLKAITSSGIASEVEEDYVGPTVWRRCVATPASIPVASPAPTGGAAPTAATTARITVDGEGQPATPRFSVRPPTLGCTITPAGELTPGTTPGTVTVRAGDSANFDETTVTLTAAPRPAQPAPSPRPTHP